MNKILIVSAEFPPQPGGIGNHAWNIASQLTKKGSEIIVLTNSRSENGIIEKDFDVLQEFKVVRVQRDRYSLFTYWNRWKMYYKLMKTEKPTVILASGKFSLWLVGLYPFLKKIKKAAVLHGSEVNLKTWWEKILINKSLRNMNVIIAVSNFTKQFIDTLNLSSVTVIPNGFNPKVFEISLSKKTNNKSPVLITVGTLSQRKGQHNVINALPELRIKFPNIQYHMVGIPSEKEKLERLANDLNITDLVTFHGALIQKNMVALLARCDIFVMLSESTVKGDVEGFGIALIEANYLGIPTIGSTNCGIEDAIDNHKSGILIGNKNVNEFLVAIEEIMENNEFYVNNANNWSNKHKWETIIQRYIKILE